MAAMERLSSINNDWLEIEFNELGVHPFITISFKDGEGSVPAAILGARHLRTFHKGASFPRLICGGEEEESGAKLELIGSGAGHVSWSDMRLGLAVETTLELSADTPLLRVEHRLTAQVDVELNRAFDRFDFVFTAGSEGPAELDYIFTPHLRPAADRVIGDHVFRSPAVILQQGEALFALVPDLEALSWDGGQRYYMDLNVSEGENQSPAVCFGLGLWKTRRHLYFKSDFDRKIHVPSGGTLVLAYYLFLGKGGLSRMDIPSFIWRRYAQPHLASGLPQVVSFDRYASAGLTRIFKRPDLFRQFELEGQPCGGTVGIHLATRGGVRLMGYRELGRYLRTQDLSLSVIRKGIEFLTGRPGWTSACEKMLFGYGPKVPPQVFFQSWYNNLRSAYGAYWFARKWGDRELMARALEVKNLAVLAPAEGGAFPAVCYATDEGVYWSRGTRAFKHVDEYNTADCATTAYYMALWFRDHESDPRLLRRCRKFADFLLGVQLPSGAFPAWVRPKAGTTVPSPELKESAMSACPAMFLALLCLLDGEEAHLESARKAMEFVAAEVMPKQKWFDYETFYSCSYKRMGLFDPNTGSFAQNTMSMYWAAEAFRLLHFATGEGSYLELGLEVLQHLLMYQQAWDPPFLSINALGGFGVMNTDGEWNDARQALFASLLLDYYRATGGTELAERGIAALRASFTTMYLEQNWKVAPGNMSGASREETGSVAENYGHFGFDGHIPGFIDSDWGAGSACQAAAYAQKHYGDIFVDWGRRRAFGINGCRVAGMEFEGDRLSLDVESNVEDVGELLLAVSDDAPRGAAVSVNGSALTRGRTGHFSVKL